MKIQLNNQTAELREELDDECAECPFSASKYSRCPYCTETILDCYDKSWIIVRPADIFSL